VVLRVGRRMSAGHRASLTENLRMALVAWDKLDDGRPHMEIAAVALVSIALSLADLAEWTEGYEDCGPVERIARSLSRIAEAIEGRPTP
jgi:hypothetical protein